MPRELPTAPNIIWPREMVAAVMELAGAAVSFVFRFSKAVAVATTNTSDSLSSQLNT